jgi:hypothetical protein
MICLQPLVFTTSSFVQATEMAELIDGYCQLVGNQKHSLLNRKIGEWTSVDAYCSCVELD